MLDQLDVGDVLMVTRIDGSRATPSTGLVKFTFWAPGTVVSWAGIERVSKRQFPAVSRYGCLT
jgi:hypothetical protein